MDITVNIDILNDWIDNNRPNGLARLSVESGISPSTIANSRRGMVPKKDRTRMHLSRAIGVPEDILFPLAATRGKRTK